MVMSSRIFISQRRWLDLTANGSSPTTSTTLSVVPSSAIRPPRISTVVDARNVETFDNVPIRLASTIRFSRVTTRSIH